MLPLAIRVKRLAHLADAGLVRFGVTLLSIDVFFIAVFTASRIYTAFYHDNALMLGERWHIGLDGSYAEMFGYLKTAIIVAILMSIRRKRQRPIYLALVLVFTVVLVDDALQLHEQLGRGLAAALGLQSSAGPLSRHFGELIVWAFIGSLLLTGVRAAFARSPQQDRTNGILLIGALAVLVLFAVLVDFAHVLMNYEFRFRGGDILFTIIEDGGEQITLSLICGLALIIQREVRERDGRE